MPASGNIPQGKPLCTERAEILFTHFGICGPAILDVSNTFVGAGLRRALLTIDFFPEIPRENLDAQILERCKTFPNRTIGRALDGFHAMPARLLEHLERSLGADACVSVCRLPKTGRVKALDMLKRTTAHGQRHARHGIRRSHRWRRGVGENRPENRSSRSSHPEFSSPEKFSI